MYNNKTLIFEEMERQREKEMWDPFLTQYYGNQIFVNQALFEAEFLKGEEAFVFIISLLHKIKIQGGIYYTHPIIHTHTHIEGL